MSILLAAALSLTPAQATNTNNTVIVAGDYDQISRQEIEQRMIICADYKTGKIKPTAIINVFNLDTQRKRRDFEFQCMIMDYALRAGYNMAVKDFRKGAI